MMKRINQCVSTVIIALAALVSCDNMTSIYQKYLEEGEIFYAPKLDSIKFYAGNNQVYFKFWTFNATNVKTVDLYWDEDSLIVPVTPSSGWDSVMVTVPCKTEKSYTFKIRTTDIFGNHSLWITGFGNSYGNLFQQSLANRTVKSFTLAGNDGEISWFPPAATLVRSEIRYTDGSQQEQTVVVPSSQNTTKCTGLPNNRFEVRSFFLPEPDAIDTFAISWESVRPLYQVPRSGWSVKYVNSWHGMPPATSINATEGPAEYVFDGLNNTHWHTSYTNFAVGAIQICDVCTRIPPPHTLVLDFGEPIDIVQVEVYRRINNNNTQTVIVYAPAVDDELLTNDDIEWLGNVPYTGNGASPLFNYHFPGITNSNWKELGRYDFPSTANATLPDVGIYDASGKNARSRYLKLILPNSRSAANVSIAEIYVLGR